MTRALEFEFQGEYWVEAIVETSFEANYGADIDGNRGEPTTFIDSIELRIWTQDESGLLIEIMKHAEPKLFDEAEKHATDLVLLNS